MPATPDRKIAMRALRSSNLQEEVAEALILYRELIMSSAEGIVRSSKAMQANKALFRRLRARRKSES